MCRQSSLSSGCGWNPLVDLLAGGGVRHILLRGAAHVDLVDLSQELLGFWRMCGGGVICYAVQPAMPEQQIGKHTLFYNTDFKKRFYCLNYKSTHDLIMYQLCISKSVQK